MPKLPLNALLPSAGPSLPAFQHQPQVQMAGYGRRSHWEHDSRGDMGDYGGSLPGPAPVASNAAPGFDHSAPAATKKLDLPKVWEYEDPLKDVHGPFTAAVRHAQLLGWFGSCDKTIITMPPRDVKSEVVPPRFPEAYYWLKGPSASVLTHEGCLLSCKRHHIMN